VPRAAEKAASGGSKPLQPHAKPSGGPTGAVHVDEALWAEKYRPQTLDQLVGNADHIKRLVHWLSAWHSKHASADHGQGKGKQSEHKAVLISGPPGVGKTTAARVVLKQAGYDVVELNASDTRSEKSLQAGATDMLGNTSIADFANGGSGTGGAAGRMALVMDEVDGMSAGDRGGMQLLIKLIERSKMPVICCCNDRQSAKIKTLANHCLDLRFRRPGHSEIAISLRRVAQREGYNIDVATLEKVAEATNGDIRQVLNLLQMWRPQSSTLRTGDVSANMSGCYKDIDVGPFDVGHKFFKEVGTSTLDARLRHYFVDSSMTPLLVQDSYLSVHLNMPQMAAQRQQLASLNRAALAAESIAEADVIGARISREQQWSLAPLHGVMSCVRPGFHMAGILGKVNFPAWLGRNSTATKRKRLLRECAAHMQCHISATGDEVRREYLPALRPPLVQPLLRGGAEGVDAVLALMDDYSLTKDDFDAVMEMQLLPSGTSADIAQVATNAKTALTRKYNQTHLAVQKARASAASKVPERFDEDGAAIDDGADAEDDDEGGAEADELVKRKVNKGKAKETKGKESKAQAKGGKAKAKR